eukprot:gene9903-biopygen10208
MWPPPSPPVVDEGQRRRLASQQSGACVAGGRGIEMRFLRVPAQREGLVDAAKTPTCRYGPRVADSNRRPDIGLGSATHRDPDPLPARMGQPPCSAAELRPHSCAQAARAPRAGSEPLPMDVWGLRPAAAFPLRQESGRPAAGITSPPAAGAARAGGRRSAPRYGGMGTRPTMSSSAIRARRYTSAQIWPSGRILLQFFMASIPVLQMVELSSMSSPALPWPGPGEGFQR